MDVFYVEDNTWAHVDMEYLFECSTPDIKLNTRRDIRYLQAIVLTIFRRFPTTFQRFPKIRQNLSEGHTNISEHSPKLPNI